MRTACFGIGMMNAKRARYVAGAALIVLAAEAVLLLRTNFKPRSAEADAYESVYYTAFLTGRSTDAALRKVHYRTELLMKELGMTESQAAAEAARSMIWSAGDLCAGG
jgi:hypothetical protein